MVVASSAEGPASSGSVPTMAMNTMAMRPTHACLQQQQQQQRRRRRQQRQLCIRGSGCMLQERGNIKCDPLTHARGK
jgi:hypothetical protein